MIPDYLTRVYENDHDVDQCAHLVVATTDDAALCGAESDLVTGWFGTGSQDEYEIAAELPLCRACVRAA